MTSQITLSRFPEESIGLFKQFRPKWMESSAGIAEMQNNIMLFTARLFYQESLPEHISAWIDVLEETEGLLQVDAIKASGVGSPHRLLFAIDTLVEQLKGLLVIRTSYSGERFVSCYGHRPILEALRFESLDEHELSKAAGAGIHVTKGLINNLLDARLVERTSKGRISLTAKGSELVT